MMVMMVIDGGDGDDVGDIGGGGGYISKIIKGKIEFKLNSVIY